MDTTEALEKHPALRKALESVAWREGVHGARYHVAPGSQATEGCTSTLYRTVILGKDAKDREKVLRLMSKTTQAEEMRTVFVVEGLMYSTVLTAMEEITAMTEEKPWPRGFYTSTEGSSAPCIVMSDLRAEGFVMMSLAEDCRMDEAHCRLALQQVARLHGAGLALSLRRPDAFERYKRDLVNVYETPLVKAFFRRMAQVTLTAPAWIEDIYPEGSEVNVLLKKVYSAFAEDILTLLCPDSQKGYTIVHGDCQIKNIMFKYDEATGRPTACRLYDFQTSRFANPALDLSTLLLLGTDGATRAACWEELLRHYHAEVLATLRAAGCSDAEAAKAYPWDQFLSLFREASTWALCMSPWKLYINARQQQGAQALAEVVSEAMRASSSAKAVTTTNSTINDNSTSNSTNKNSTSSNSSTSKNSINNTSNSNNNSSNRNSTNNNSTNSTTTTVSAPGGGVTFEVTVTLTMSRSFHDLVQDLADWGWLPTLAEMDDRIARAKAWRETASSATIE